MAVELVRYNAARKALAECRRIDEIKAIRNEAVAAQAYARQAKDRQMIDHATEIRMRAEIKAGELLTRMAETKERGRGRKRKDFPAASLSDLGVTASQSHRWRRLAALPAEKREEKIQLAQKKAVNVIDGASRRTRQEMHAEDTERVRRLVVVPGKFRALVIDPPWEQDWLSPEANASLGYATMNEQELLDLDVLQWAEDSCHVYLWTTNNFASIAFRLIKAWGFDYKTMLTWRKPRWGRGQYFRNMTEHVLFGVRGELRTRSDSIPTIFDGKMGDHSEKPEEFYDIVRSASHGPFGECFQRTPRPDFTNLYRDGGSLKKFSPND